MKGIVAIDIALIHSGKNHVQTYLCRITDLLRACLNRMPFVFCSNRSPKAGKYFGYTKRRYQKQCHTAIVL